MVTGADGSGFAYVSEGIDAQSLHYRVGETLPGGGTLVAVRNRSIEVQTGAGIATLALGFSAAPTFAGTRRSATVSTLGSSQASLEAALQEARGDDVPVADHGAAASVLAVVPPNAEDRRRSAAIELALGH